MDAESEDLPVKLRIGFFGLKNDMCLCHPGYAEPGGAMDGAFFETYVVTEIVKSYFNAGKPVDLFYYRDVDKKEIDLLIVEGDKCTPLRLRREKNRSTQTKTSASCSDSR